MNTPVENSGLAWTTVRGVRVGCWNPLRDGRMVNNFGDVMGPQLIERIAPTTPAAPNDSSAPMLVGQGSVLHLVSQGATIWGTGINAKTSATGHIPPDLDVRAVRGPWTRRILLSMGIPTPAIYGDPGLLTARLFPELALVRQSADALCVPNFHDMVWLAPEARAAGFEILDPQTDYLSALRSIARAKFVVATSLHGVVVADALGIPARLVASRVESMFKYRDYLAGTGRPLTRVAASFDEAIRIGEHAALDMDLDLLMEAFPYDLWQEDQPVVTAAGPSSPEGVSATTRPTDEWLTVWSQPNRDTLAASSQYLSHLDRLDAEGPLDSVYAVRAIRLWDYPDVPAANLPGASAVLDSILTGADPAATLPFLQHQRTGLTVEVYDYHVAGGGALIAVTVHNPDPSNPIDHIELFEQGGEAWGISTKGLMGSALQVRVDLDIPIWGAPERLSSLSPARARVTFLDGSLIECPVAFQDRVPEFSTPQTGFDSERETTACPD